MKLSDENRKALEEILWDASGEPVPGYSGTNWSAFIPQIEAIFQKEIDEWLLEEEDE